MRQFIIIASLGPYPQNGGECEPINEHNEIYAPK